MQLNPAQAEAVRHTEGPLLVFAGAGSGKTRVLTARIARLLENGVSPWNIIAITFTNKAAREMKERVAAVSPLGAQVWVSTFHSACTRILRQEIEALGYGRGFTIYDTADSERLMKDCISELNLSDAHYSAKGVLGAISAQKNELVGPLEFEMAAGGDFRLGNIAACYGLYQRKLMAANALDFDDIIMKLVELLTREGEVLARWQERFHYVMVDEYQDTNRAQYVLANLLAGGRRNLCVVGDDDQSIYGWRGANIRNILDFEKDHPGARTIKLEQNYRCTKTILAAANAVIAGNEVRADKSLWTENDEGAKIKLYVANDDRDEAAFVARLVAREAAAGAKYGDFALLYRVNAQSRVLEEQLIYAGIPYRIFSGVKFYDRMEVKDALAYLKAINNPADDMALARIINVPKRGIGQTSIGKIREYALAEGKSFFAAMLAADKIAPLGKKAAEIKSFAAIMREFADFADGNPVPALLVKILEETGYSKTHEDGTEEGRERVANINELVAKAKVFAEESDDKSLGRFLEDVSLVSDIDAHEEGADAVSLMTLHSSKGLEFGTVIMAGFEEHMLPAARSVESADPGAVEEERRLCYVGFTRAKRLLCLIRAQVRRRYDMSVSNRPSRFLAEIPAGLVLEVDGQGEEKKKGAAPPRKAAPAAVARRPPPPPVIRPAPPRPAPKKGPPEYSVGDSVKQPKHGIGVVASIDPAGADYEVTVDFPEKGRKKFMSSLARLEKV